MADLNEKKSFPKAQPLDEIPVPVAAVPPPAQRAPRRRRFLVAFFKFVLLTWLWVCARRWTHAGVQQELEAHEGRWISRVFGGEAWTWSPRKVLHGKKAEKLFLCVASLLCWQFAFKAH